MNGMIQSSVLLFTIWLATPGAIAQENLFQNRIEKLPLTIRKPSDRVLIIRTKTGNSNVAVLATKKGMVMLDAGFSPQYTRHIKTIAQREFGRDDWYGLIHTNPELLNGGGNRVFFDLPIFAHSSVADYLFRVSENLSNYLQQRALEFYQRVNRSELQLKTIDPDSEKITALQEWIRLCKYIARDWDKGFQLSYPTITFENKLNLHLGDLTLHLLYFGKTPEDGQVLVWVPDEQFLWLADVFHAAHILPYGSHYGPEGADVDRWLNVLNTILNNENPLNHIYRTNGFDMWTKEILISRRDFIYDLSNKVRDISSRGMDLQTAQDRLSNYKESFPYISEYWENQHESIVKGDIKNVVLGLWKKSHQSAAEALYTQLDKKDLQTAQNLFSKIYQESESFYLLESEFNDMGYRFLAGNEKEKAVYMFQMAIKLFPKSANLYDSLGEAYKKNGQKDLAIKSYQKSLELNPENDNAKEMLKKLR